jgi:hypothetical protein
MEGTEREVEGQQDLVPGRLYERAWDHGDPVMTDELRRGVRPVARPINQEGAS